MTWPSSLHDPNLMEFSSAALFRLVCFSAECHVGEVADAKFPAHPEKPF
jgi:hypothetical protein